MSDQPQIQPQFTVREPTGAPPAASGQPPAPAPSQGPTAPGAPGAAAPVPAQGGGSVPNPAQAARPVPAKKGWLHDDTNVGILGFSASGKTVYLTMVYYATALAEVAEAGFGEWTAEWGDNATRRYLERNYRTLRGINDRGEIQVDPTGTRVERGFPRGTIQQSFLRFALSRPSLLRRHNLNITTLDIAGEVLERGLGDASNLSTDMAARWGQIRELIEGSKAILFFFNALRWREFDYSPQLVNLTSLLSSLPRPPKVVVIVMTGIDILTDAAEIDALRTDVEAKMNRPGRNLERKGIAWKIEMVSSLGQNFVQKAPLELIQADKTGRFGRFCIQPGHKCPLCQTLVTDPAATPRPENIAAPWNFIYDKLFNRPLPLELLALLGALLRAGWVARVVLALLLLAVPAGFAAWQVQAGWQAAARLDQTLAADLSPAALETARAAAGELAANPVTGLLKLDFATPEAAAQRQRFRAFSDGLIQGTDAARPPAERLAVLEGLDRSPDYPTSWKRLLPLTETRLAASLGQVTDAGSGLMERLRAALRALGDPSLTETQRAQVREAAETSLTAARDEAATTLGDLRAQFLDPRAQWRDYGPEIERWRAVAAEVRQGPLATSPAARELAAGGPGLPGGVPALTSELEAASDWARAVSLPAGTPEQRQSRLEALRAFRTTWKNSGHVLADRAGVELVAAERAVLDDWAAARLAELQAQPAPVLGTNPGVFLERLRDLAEVAARAPEAPAARAALAERQKLLDAAPGQLRDFTAFIRDRAAEPLFGNGGPSLTPERVAAELNQTAQALHYFDQLEAAGGGGPDLTEARAAVLDYRRLQRDVGRLLADFPAGRDEPAPLVEVFERFAADTTVHPHLAAQARALAAEARQRALLAAMTEARAALPPFNAEVAELSAAQYDNLLRDYQAFLDRWGQERAWAAANPLFAGVTAADLQALIRERGRPDPLAEARQAVQTLESLKQRRAAGQR